MIMSGELRFTPDDCKWQWEDNCFDCIHFVCLDGNNGVECNYECNENEDEVEE